MASVNLSTYLVDSGQQAFFSELGSMIESGGRLDLLTCNLAGTQTGDALIDVIEHSAGVDVAASDDVTGNAVQGADWLLERGNIDAVSLYFDAGRLAEYDSTLLAESELAHSDIANFGWHVAMDGDYLVTTSDQANGGIGAAYVYQYVAGSWQQTFTLTPADGVNGDAFGWSVAISGTTIAVGFANHDVIDDSYNRGSVYLFDATTGAQINRIDDTINDGNFATSLALSGTNLLVGATGVSTNAGAVYLYDSSTGNLVRAFTDPAGTDWDQFGSSVAISGNLTAVGAERSDSHKGRVYLIDATNGNTLHTLQVSDYDISISAYFGNSVALSGTKVVIGAYMSTGAAWLSGSAYVFDTTTANELCHITASDGASAETFGGNVAIIGNTVFVTARNDDSATGSVYSFNATTGAELSKITASDKAANDNFGTAIASSGTSIVVSAYAEKALYAYNSAAPLVTNNSPTGAPTISGTVTQGQTLTAATGSIADADGLGTFSYQWYAAGSAIGGATTSSYTLTQAEIGKAITVKVAYTDGLGTAENVASAATAAVANVNDAPTGQPTIDNVMPWQGDTLTADASGIADPDGLGTFSYQWTADGSNIAGATGSTFTLTQARSGKEVRVKFSYTDAQGTVETVTSDATFAVTDINDAPTGKPTISGTTSTGQTLTANVGEIADADGLGTFSYQWKADGANAEQARLKSIKLSAE